jgi:sulfur-oxidizing protein SoxZ
MTGPSRIRAASKDGITEIRILMTHEMETGLRRDGAGALVPALFIQEVAVKLNGADAALCQLGPSIARNPDLLLKLKGGAPGDTVSVGWKDSRGESRTDSVRVS